MKDEIKVFVPDPIVLTTLSGETIEIKALNFEQELRLCSLLGDTLKSLKLEKIDLSAFKGQELLQVIPEIFSKVPASLEKALEIIVEKDENWIKANLNLELALEVIIPFFGQLYSVIAKKVRFNPSPKEKV